MSIKKINRNKQVRLDDATAERIERLVKISEGALSESNIIRLAIRAGLPRLESGEENPFSESSRMNTAARAPGLALAAEDAATFRKSRRAG